MNHRRKAGDVTAVVLTTGEATTEAAIECIRRQTVSVFDTIVVRDISPFHRALNHGASLVTTPYFVQVDADMLLDADCIETLRKAMRPDVGIAVGHLRDAMMGSVVGVKLFRRACFDVTMFPDSISPDTDFVEAIGHAGWRTVHVGGTRAGRMGSPRTLGKHAPDYRPDYVFRKFLMEGHRYRHRSRLGGLQWQYGELTRSAHPHALLARVALAAGFFDADRGDALGRKSMPDHDGIVAALAGATAPPAGGVARDWPGPLREGFADAWQAGRDAAHRSETGGFRQLLDELERLPDDSGR